MADSRRRACLVNAMNSAFRDVREHPRERDQRFARRGRSRCGRGGRGRGSELIQDNGIASLPKTCLTSSKVIPRQDAQSAGDGSRHGLAAVARSSRRHNGSFAVESDLGRAARSGPPAAVRPGSNRSADPNRSGWHYPDKKNLYECKNNDDDRRPEFVRGVKRSWRKPL